MKRIATAVTSLALCVSMLAGCGGGKTDGGKDNAAFEKTTPDTYPIKTDATLRYWLPLSGHVSAHSASLNDTPFAKGLIEKTGINVTFIHPPAGSENEKFSLMIASDDVPDIIEYSWVNNYPGGAEKAINDKAILRLNEIIDAVCPNLKKFYSENPEIEKQMKTESGSFYTFPFVVKASALSTYIGPMVRGDLLEKSGLDAPETIDDWDKMLRAFKKLGVEVPLTLKLNGMDSGDNFANVSAFLGAFGITGTFFVKDGKVKYGPNEPEYKDYVELMTKWYADGLLDKNFTDTDGKRITAIMGNGNGGSAFGSAGGEFGKWIPLLKQVDPNAYFVPVKYPVKNKGDRPMYGQKTLPVSGFGASISAESDNVEIAARLLDFGYSEEGHMYYNFGTEGVSYTMKDGVPTYTDIITDNEKNGGLGIGPAMGKYQRACYNGPFEQDENYIYQFYALDEQKKALDLWPDTDALKYKMPLVPMTAEENNEYTRIMTDVDAYREQVLYKTITGKMPVSQLDEYYQGIKDRGIERAIEIQQAAYDRYLKN